MAALMKLTAIALLTPRLASPCRRARIIQLLPAGEFSGRDGRPGKGLTWKLSDELKGRALAAKLNARHAQNALQPGLRTPVARRRRKRPAGAGLGLGVEVRVARRPGPVRTDVQWTARAKQMIEDGEYAYFSPVIVYDKKTGLK
jgi:phage I-like protein